jgi:hypothetical protein
MLPRHRIASTVHISASTALDTVVSFVAPAALDENAERRGVFFVLIHADEIDPLLPWLNTFVHFLNQTYDTLFNEEADITVERAIAITQQRAKHKLQQLISEARSLSADDISFCLGAVNGYDVHLAHSGNIKAYLLHTLKAQYEDESKYRWIDVTESGDEEEDSSSVSVISGRMQQNDTLFICSESVIDGLGLEPLQKIISRASVDGAKMQLEKAVATVGGRVSYGAIILRPTVEHIAAELPAYKSRPDQSESDSMTSLHHSEKTARELLDPKRHPSPFNGLFDRIKGFKTPKKAEPKNIKETPSGNPFSVNVGQQTSNRQKINNASKAGGRIIDNLTSQIRSLPHSSRRLLLIALMLGYLFTQSLVFLANRQNEEQSQIEQQQVVERIQDNLDQAESSLIFNNDEETARLLSEAEALIEGLPQDTRAQEERYRVLSNDAASLRHRLERVHQSETKKIVDLNFPANLITSYENGLIAGSRTGTYNLITPEGVVESITIDGLNTVSAELISTDENGKVFISTDQSEIELNLDENILVVKPVTDNGTIVDLVHYRDNLYTLSADDKQIYRYTNGPSFTNPSPWVNGNADSLASATSMTIDGNVYVLTKTGEIYKYSRGVAQNWSASPTYGETDGMTKLVSPADSEYLYALDSERNRIVMWQKSDGKLINQFSFPSLGEILDFDVRIDNQLMYLLTSTEIATAAIVK